MRTFELNGKTVKAVPADYNLFCELSLADIELDQVFTKPMAVARFYVATCLGISIENAGKEIENHIINGGNLDDVLEVFRTELEESGFFRHLLEMAQKNVEENPTAE